jgi:hypothetical protein
VWRARHHWRRSWTLAIVFKRRETHGLKSTLFHTDGVSVNLSLITGFFPPLLHGAVTDFLTNCRPVYLVLLGWWNQGWRTQHASEKWYTHTLPNMDVGGEPLERARMVCRSVNGLLLIRRRTGHFCYRWSLALPSLWAALLST